MTKKEKEYYIEFPCECVGGKKNCGDIVFVDLHDGDVDIYIGKKGIYLGEKSVKKLIKWLSNLTLIN